MSLRSANRPSVSDYGYQGPDGSRVDRIPWYHTVLGTGGYREGTWSGNKFTPTQGSPIIAQPLGVARGAGGLARGASSPGVQGAARANPADILSRFVGRTTAAMGRHPIRTGFLAAGAGAAAISQMLRGQGGGQTEAPLPPLGLGGPSAPGRGGGQGLVPLGSVSSGVPGVVGGSDPFRAVQSAISGMQAEKNQIEGRYQARLAELRKLYQFAETPQEKAQIQFILSDIEGQRAAATKIIDNVYGKAIADASARADTMRATSAAEGQAVGDLYRQGAERTVQGIGEIAEGFHGTGLGVGAVPVSEDASDWVALQEAAAPREQALTERLGNISAEDVSWLADQMGAERGAQSGEAQRLAMQLAAMAQIEHDRRVQERIAAERMQYAGQAGQYGLAGLEARTRAGENLSGLQMELARMQQGHNQWLTDRSDRYAMADRDWQQQQQMWNAQQRAQQQQMQAEQGQADARPPRDSHGQIAWANAMAQQAPAVLRAYWDSLNPDVRRRLQGDPVIAPHIGR